MQCCREQMAPRRTATLCCACAILTAAGGCAPMMQMRPAADSYTYDVGVASSSEIHAKTSDVLSRLGYRVVRDADGERVYMESGWKRREPVDDEERARGYEIISRVTLAGTPQEIAGASSMYHLLLTVENRFVPLRGTRRDARDWSSSADYARSIVKQMSLAFGGNPRAVADEPNPF
jgi:hypothetical protein